MADIGSGAVQLHRSWIPPLYPGMLGVLQISFPGSPVLALLLVQALTSTLSVLLLYLLGQRLFGFGTALLAAAGLAVWPPLLAKVAYVDPVTIETAALLGTVWLLVRLADSSRGGDAAAAGAAVAFGLLARPAFVVSYACLCALWIGSRRISVGRVAVCIGVATLCLAPWMIRNHAVHGDFLFVSSNGGYNFWIGNNPMATGEAYAEDGQPVWTKMPDHLRDRLRQSDELERDRLLFAEGVAWVRAHPGDFFGLTLRRVAYFWWFRPRAGIGQPGGLSYPGLWTWAYKLLYAGLLAVAAAGIYTAWRERWRLLPVYASMLGTTAAYSLFFVHMRYRMPLEPLLILFAAHAAISIIRARSPSGERRRTG